MPQKDLYFFLRKVVFKYSTCLLCVAVRRESRPGYSLPSWFWNAGEWRVVYTRQALCHQATSLAPVILISNESKVDLF